MSRSVRVVLLCEDRQHETFVKQFLLRDGWNVRNIRPVISPHGRGSAEQFVRERFPIELQAVRAKRGERVWLIVMIDGDDQGVSARRASLDDACTARGIAAVGHSENVLICVPTWSIETWFAFLAGEDVDETRRDYPRLPRVRHCQRHVDELSERCRQDRQSTQLPPSLEDACVQYRHLPLRS